MALWGGASVADQRARAEAAIADVAALGATDVALVVAWGQHDVTSTELAPTSATAPDDVVRAAIAAAADHGLRALVFPIVTLDELAAGQWRGTLRPADVGAWWSGYEKFILHYARLAADEGAAALSVGSELGSTEGWRDRWFHLVSRVEKAFTGELTYSANWDHYEQVSFWQRLDWIGVNAYFELTDDADASEAALTRGWRDHVDALLAYAADAARPLVLTEVGYPSVDGGAVAPWDYTRAGKVDVEEQRRAFAAFAAAWDGTALGGAFVWEWGPGGADDRGYAPWGKPAECVLRGWFGGGDAD
ncbi:MAG: hypothetical protein H6709_02935 [Kofleriaceae bacterium]|nr:hypothetical protein [Kofleriaceae bacterium]MCB9571023.1 hypothetical protein [Kofleriaceae bacterium]